MVGPLGEALPGEARERVGVVDRHLDVALVHVGEPGRLVVGAGAELVVDGRAGSRAGRPGARRRRAASRWGGRGRRTARRRTSRRRGRHGGAASPPPSNDDLRPLAHDLRAPLLHGGGQLALPEVLGLEHVVVDRDDVGELGLGRGDGHRDLLACRLATFAQRYLLPRNSGVNPAGRSGRIQAMARPGVVDTPPGTGPLTVRLVLRHARGMWRARSRRIAGAAFVFFVPPALLFFVGEALRDAYEESSGTARVAAAPRGLVAAASVARFLGTIFFAGFLDLAIGDDYFRGEPRTLRGRPARPALGAAARRRRGGERRRRRSRSRSSSSRGSSCTRSGASSGPVVVQERTRRAGTRSTRTARISRPALGRWCSGSS